MGEMGLSCCLYACMYVCFQTPIRHPYTFHRLPHKSHSEQNLIRSCSLPYAACVPALMLFCLRGSSLHTNISSSYLSYFFIRQTVLSVAANGLSSWLASTLSDLKRSSNSVDSGVCAHFVCYFTQFCLFQVCAREFIYLVSEQSSLFWLFILEQSILVLWIQVISAPVASPSPVLPPAPSLSIPVSLAPSFPPSPVRSLHLCLLPLYSCLFLALPSSRSVFFLPTLLPSWKITVPIWTEPCAAVKLLVLAWHWLKIVPSQN